MSQTHTHSYYAASANQELQCPTLQGHHSADICILGAGITAVSYTHLTLPTIYSV